MRGFWWGVAAMTVPVAVGFAVVAVLGYQIAVLEREIGAVTP